MGKKILIGSIFVLALILLMPSIPAVQQKSVEEGMKQEMQEKIDTINLDKLEDIKNLEWIRHPILQYIVFFIYLQRWKRVTFLGELSVDWISDWHGMMKPTVVRPLIFIYFLIYFTITMGWIWTWDLISEILGWGWFEYEKEDTNRKHHSSCNYHTCFVFISSR